MSYADRAEQRRKDRVMKWPAGEYTALFKGFTKTKGRKAPHNTMFNLEFSAIEGPAGEEEKLAKLREKGRKITHRFVFSDKGYGFDDFLVFLQDLGADLSVCRSETEDPEYTDLSAILQQLELTPPKLKLTITWPEDGGQFYNVRFTEIPKVFGTAAAPTAAPAAPAAAPAAPAEAAEIIYYMDAHGAVANGDRATVQGVITAGYTGQVNVNNTGWVAAANAGFIVPPPAAATPAAPAAPEPFVVDPAPANLPEATAAALEAAQTPAADPTPAPVADPAPAAPEVAAAPVPEVPAAAPAANATGAGAPVDPFA